MISLFSFYQIESVRHALGRFPRNCRLFFELVIYNYREFLVGKRVCTSIQPLVYGFLRFQLFPDEIVLME
jgi:hypothetical protein